MKILQHFCIGKGYDFDWYTLLKLRLGSALVCRNKFSTNICTQELHVFPVVSDENKSASTISFEVILSQHRVHGRFGGFCKDLLSQVTCSPTFHTIQGMVYPSWELETFVKGIEHNLLVCTVDRDINRWILVNISQSQATIHYQLF